MSPETIIVDRLSKTYQVPEREGGFGSAVRSFFKRKYKDVKAVQQVDFKITQGEIVGFLGPNGAGKTTTLKMLSGLLHPTGGVASVLGFTPWELKPEYLRSMTLVMGQRNRLAWDIPAITEKVLSALGSFLKNSIRSSKDAMPSYSPRITMVGTVSCLGSTSGSFEHMST